MSLQELFTAMNMFSNSAKEFGASRAINDAQTQVEHLKAQDMDEMQKRSELSALSNNLTMRLAGLGAPVSQIQTVAGAIAPEKINDSKDAFIQGTMAGKKGGALLGLADGLNKNADYSKNLDRENELAKARITASAMQMKQENQLDGKSKAQILSYQKEFNKLTKDDTAQLNNLGQAERLLPMGNPVADNTLRTFLARASGEKGPLSITDIEQYGGSRDLATKVQRFVQRQANGKELTAKDREQMLQIINSYRETMSDSLADRIEQTAGQISTNLGGTTDGYYEHLIGQNPTLRKVLEKRLSGGQASTSNQQTGSAIPSAPTATDYTAAENYLKQPNQDPETAAQIRMILKQRDLQRAKAGR